MRTNRVKLSPARIALATLAVFNLPACQGERKDDSRREAPQPLLAVQPAETFTSCEQVITHVSAAETHLRQISKATWHRDSIPQIAVENRQLPNVGSTADVLGNRQEAGVAEADFTAIGKHHIVLANGNKISVLKRTDLSLITSFYQARGETIQGLYIDGERLLVITNTGKLTIFSLTENTKPGIIHERAFNQKILTSRVTGGHLVLVTQQHLTSAEKITENKIAGVACNQIAIPQVNPYMTSLATVIALNISSPAKESMAGAFAHAARVYMNEESLYIPEASSDDLTGIHKFALDSSATEIRLVASGKAPGVMQDDFSMREVTLAGSRHLVIATNSLLNKEVPVTMGDWTEDPSFMPPPRTRGSGRANNLFILSQDGPRLTQKGSVTGLAPGETIRAVRYVDDMAYIVTFRQVDPLFAISIKDPAAPKVLGELKIPGFSEYLHPVAAGRLLGVGVEASETGRLTGEVKVSLFDTSKPESLKELAAHKRRGTSEANSDYKAFMFDEESKIAVIPVGGEAMVIEVGEEKLTEKALLKQSGEIRRAFKFDGLLFTVSNQQIVARDLNDPVKVIMKSSNL
jgi:uncharacterized secreted protein with C-terminal beta-propeller domain